MKKLFIIRHAKSDWENEELHDLERPLAERGLKDARIMGELLALKGVHPDLMLSSPALRAFSTCRIFSDIIRFEKNRLKVDQILYFGEVAEIISMLNNIGDDHETVCIFGHNPTFSILANKLCTDFGTEMPTCGVVALEFDTKNKSRTIEGTGNLVWFEYPKNNR